jgi:hypothetical protein
LYLFCKNWALISTCAAMRSSIQSSSRIVPHRFRHGRTTDRDPYQRRQWSTSCCFFPLSEDELLSRGMTLMVMMSPDFYRKVWSERQASKEKNYIFDCVARRIYVHLLQYHGRLSILTHRHLEGSSKTILRCFRSHSIRKHRRCWSEWDGKRLCDPCPQGLETFFLLLIYHPYIKL